MEKGVEISASVHIFDLAREKTIRKKADEKNIKTQKHWNDTEHTKCWAILWYYRA